MNGIVYLHVSARYTPFLVASLMSLRRHTDAPVCILTDSTGEESARQLARDPRLGEIEVRPSITVQSGHTSFGIAVNQTKPDVPLLSPFDKSIYLDSDTIVVGDISALWPLENEVVLTERNMFRRSSNSKRRMNCRQWLEIDRERAEKACDRRWQRKYPVINAGVHGFSQLTKPFHEDVRRMTHARPINGADEIATQIVYPDYPHRVLGKEYNANVWIDLGNPDVVIWHGARGLFTRKPQGRALFFPLLREAVEGDIGGIRQMLPDVLLAMIG